MKREQAVHNPLEHEKALLREAAAWYVQLHGDDAGEREQAAWQAWHARGQGQQAAWQKVQALQQRLQGAAGKPGSEILQGRPPARRRSLQLLALSVVGLASLGLAWQGWEGGPDWQTYQTAHGERRSVQLADGSRVMLNSASRLRVGFSDAQRLLQLEAGEVMVDSGHETGRPFRPLVLATAEGSLRPLGTRFAVRQLDGQTELTVFQHAVEVSPARLGRRQVVEAGRQLRFGAAWMAAQTLVDDTASAWTEGKLIVLNQPLEQVVARLAAYYPGRLRCDPRVATLRVSGSFSLDQAGRSLVLLSQTLPIAVHRQADGQAVVLPR